MEKKFSFLFFDVEKRLISTDGGKDTYAIIGKIDSKEKLFCTVSSRYTSVTNEEAIKHANQVCIDFYKQQTIKNIDLIRVNHAKNLAWFAGDLASLEKKISLYEKDDHFAYLRVINSYDKSHALSYEIGVCRSACSNGMIVGEKTLAKMNIDRRNLKATTFYRNLFLEELEKILKDYIKKISSVKISHHFFDDIIRLAFAENQKQEARLTKLRHSQRDIFEDKPLRSEFSILKNIDHISTIDRRSIPAEELSAHYIRQFGETGYALFNTMTDIASHSESENSLYYHQLERSAGTWLEDFADNINEYVKTDTFSFDNYLEYLIGR